MDIFSLFIIIGSSNVLVFYHCIKILETIKLEGGKLLTQHLVSVTLLGPVVSAFASEVCGGRTLFLKDRAKRAGRAAVPVPPLSHTPNDNVFRYPHE